MAGKKEQVVMLVDPEIRDRLDALRIVTGESRARVAEMALAGHGLAQMEIHHADGLERVRELAERAGVLLYDYVRAYAYAMARQSYGPGLDKLEQDDSAVRAQLTVLLHGKGQLSG